MEDYDFPLWVTQEGGIVCYDPEQMRYVFVKKPDCLGFGIGDSMPEWWDVISINQVRKGEIN